MSDLSTGTSTSLQRGSHLFSYKEQFAFMHRCLIYNSDLNIVFLCCFQSKSANVLAVLGNFAREALDLTGFYYSGKPITVKRRANQLSRTSTGRYAFPLHTLIPQVY